MERGEEVERGRDLRRPPYQDLRVSLRCSGKQPRDSKFPPKYLHNNSQNYKKITTNIIIETKKGGYNSEKFTRLFNEDGRTP